MSRGQAASEWTRKTVSAMHQKSLRRGVAPADFIRAMQELMYSVPGGKDMHFDEIALALLIGVTAVLVIWFLWGRYAAVRLAVADNSATLADQENSGDGSEHSLGKVGHLVTALMHANEGWQQLPMSAALEGIDAIFVRKRGGRNQFDVRFVATTCTRGDDPTVNYDPHQMADAAVIEQLERLKGAKLDGDGGIDSQTIDIVIKAIKRGSVRVTKHLYAHMLGSGKTQVYSIGRDGQLLERPARAKRFNGASHRLMVRTLANELRQPLAAAAST
jgi:hypothetical protein